MNEPTLICPKCGTEIKLTESLAAPLIESIRQQYEQQLAQKDAAVAKREAAIKEQQAALAKAQESIDDQVAAKLKAERAGIAATEAKKARDALGDEIAKAQEEKAATELLLAERDAKLAEARKNELALRQERHRLQEEKEQFELEKQRAIDAERVKIREVAQKDADEQARLKLAEKDKTITDLQVRLQDALRKAEQGSQQLQGEVQELELEAILRAKFPMDTIEPVPKGQFGGDTLHHVLGPLGQVCGTILWESKRTKDWQDRWIPKLKDDCRTAKADIAIIVSQALPKDLETFEFRDGVWVAHPRFAIPLALVLRQSLIELALARAAGQGQQTKMEMIYDYMTGPRFRHRVEAIVEAFSAMREDLDKERRAIMKQWAKRDEQIERVMSATVGMYGDLQGIAGKTLQEIEGLEVKLLDATDKDS